MFWIPKLIAPMALVAGIATTTAFVMAGGDGKQPPFGKGGGQPPFGKGFGDDKKGFEGKKGEEKKVEGKKGEEKGQPGDKKGPTPPKADPIVDAWLVVLLTKITDPHDTVRDSARGAIVGVGPVAIPALQKLADGDDPAKATAARKLISAIHHGHGQAGPGGPFGQPGRPGFGAMGVGGPGMVPMGPGGFGGMPRGPMGPGGMGGGGFPGMRPMGERGGPGGERDRGPGRRDNESEIEVAPMPRDSAR